MDKIADWHHLWPLSCCGAIFDDLNYKRLSIMDHILAHVALAHLFGRIFGCLYTSVQTTMNMARDLSKEEIEACLCEEVSWCIL